MLHNSKCYFSFFASSISGRKAKTVTHSVPIQDASCASEIVYLKPAANLVLIIFRDYVGCLSDITFLKLSELPGATQQQ